MRTVPDVGMSRPAMMESNVLLPDPEAPTMAADWRGSSAKSMSWRIVRVPVESRTCLVSRSTTTMGSGMGEAARAPSGRMGVTRRRALAHCIALVAAALGGTLARAAPDPQRILVVGDSLSAEYGLARGTGWVALLEQRLAREHIDATIVNASISGDTTSGGRARLRPLLRQHHATLVIVELGANDALRGLPIEETRANLVAMAQMAKTGGARVVLVGMQIPPNYGRR